MGVASSGGTMEEEMKGFWKFFIFLVVGAVVSLAGAIIGKTVVGYILYFLGLVSTIGLFVFIFIKKSYFKGNRLKPLILGLVLSILLASSAVLLVNNAGRASLTRSQNSLLSQFTGGGGGFSGATGGGFAGRTGTGGTGGTGGGFRGGFASGGNFTTGSSSTATTGTTGTTTGTVSSAATSALRSAATRMIVETVIGWLFLGIGLIVLLISAIRFFTKKTAYTEGRWKTLVLGLVIGALLASSTTMLMTRTSFSRNRTALSSQYASAYRQRLTGTPQAGQNGTNTTLTPGAGVATISATAVFATLTPTPDALPAEVSTPEPTNTPTPEMVSSLVVCLDPNYGVGLNIRDFPSDTSTIVGTVPLAGCFTIDGQNSQYPDWYHLASGQNGLGGIQFSVDETKHQLWVYTTHNDATAASLSMVPQLAVTK
jgi:hypothetical protein